MLVDTIDDTVGARYSGMPGRLYVIDRDGKVAFKSGRGPYLFKPAELEQALVLLLQEGASQNPATTGASLSWTTRRSRSPATILSKPLRAHDRIFDAMGMNPPSRLVY